MILRHGDMFSIQNIKEYQQNNKLPLLILATTNGTLKNDGTLVMGKGAAKTLRDMLPHSELMNIGKCVKSHDIYNDAGKPYHKYGIIISHYPLKNDKVYYGLFQVKDNWYNQARLDLIAYSANCLDYFSRLNDVTIWLNYPGIGNGGLTEEEVYPFIKVLPDNVTVWKL